MAPNFADYVDHVYERSNIYVAAGDVDYGIYESPDWDFEKAIHWLDGSKSEISAVHHEKAYTAAYKIAREAIERQRRDVNPSWRQRHIREEGQPVLLIAPKANAQSSDEAFYSLMESLFEQLWPIVEPSHWREICSKVDLNLKYYFDPLKCDSDTVGTYWCALEKLLAVGVKSPKPWVKHHLCVVADIDHAGSEEVNADGQEVSAVKRFIEILENMFVTPDKGRLLFVTSKPYNITAMVENKERVVNLY
ncbi:hypothetical protein F5B20DRAFT_540755 [Whalleya microplaca]|nr:hypothetical protein F5B20DRAFT_540755 [Whalleya microplaca]